MRRGLAWLVWAVVMVSCAKTTQPLPNKNTNWLRACDADASCGEDLSCICGVCTTRCEVARECGIGGSDVACLAVDDAPQCDGAGDDRPASICVATCQRDGDCRSFGSDFTCSDQTCVQAPEAALDAGAESDAALHTAIDAGPEPLVDAGGASVSGPGMHTFCGNGQVDTGEACDDEVFAFGTCTDCQIVCDEGRANCNVDLLDGCEREIPAGQDLPAGPGAIPAGCVETLATQQAAPSSVAIDATQLYWTNRGTLDELGNSLHDGSVVAVPLGGGPLTMLATGQGLPDSIAVDGQHVYWMAQSDDDRPRRRIMRVALGGGSAEVVDEVSSAHGLALDDTYAYYVGVSDEEFGYSALFRVRKDGPGSPEQLTEDGDNPVFENTLRLGDDMLYWSSNRQIYRVAVDGAGGIEVFASPRPDDFTGIGQLAIQGDALYWLGQVGKAVLTTMPLAGGDAVTLAMLEDATTQGIAADDDHVYWSHVVWGARQVIARSDVRPGATTALLADDSIGGPQLALTETDVYIVAVGVDPATPTGVVLRLPK